MFGIASKIFGSTSSRIIKEFKGTIAKINNLENEISNLRDEDLILKTEDFKSRIKNGEDIDNILDDFA